MALAARWIRLHRLHVPGLTAMRAACTGFAQVQTAASAPAVLWAGIEEGRHAFCVIAPLRHLPRATRWRSWALAPLVATYRQCGLSAYYDADRICLSGRPITGVSAAAVGDCALVVADFAPWGEQFMEFLRQRVEAQYGWQFDTAWPTEAECAAIEDAPAVAGEA